MPSDVADSTDATRTRLDPCTVPPDPRLGRSCQPAHGERRRDRSGGDHRGHRGAQQPAAAGEDAGRQAGAQQPQHRDGRSTRQQEDATVLRAISSAGMPPRRSAQTPNARLPAPPSGNREPAPSSATAILCRAQLIRVQNTARKAGRRPAPTAPQTRMRSRSSPAAHGRTGSVTPQARRERHDHPPRPRPPHRVSAVRVSVAEARHRSGAARDPRRRTRRASWGSGPPRPRWDQFARVPSKSIVACVPSQNGLFDDPPQRHITIGSGCSISCPSGATRRHGAGDHVRTVFGRGDCDVGHDGDLS